MKNTWGARLTELPLWMMIVFSQKPLSLYMGCFRKMPGPIKATVFWSINKEKNKKKKNEVKNNFTEGRTRRDECTKRSYCGPSKHRVAPRHPELKLREKGYGPPVSEGSSGLQKGSRGRNKRGSLETSGYRLKTPTPLRKISKYQSCIAYIEYIREFVL